MMSDRFLQQHTTNNAVYFFTMNTDLSDAYLYGMNIYSTGTATFDNDVHGDYLLNDEGEVSKVRVWHDMDANRSINTGDIIIGEGEFNNTGQPLMCRIEFSTATPEYITTDAMASAYIISLDINDTAVPKDPDTGEPRTLGIVIKPECFPVDGDLIPEPLLDDFISEPNTLAIPFEHHSMLPTIQPAPRTVSMKQTPVNTTPDGILPAPKVGFSGVSGIDATQNFIPVFSNEPENSAEPTNSQHTMAVVFAVRNTASLVRFQLSVRACRASKKAPAAPTPADSVAVVMPSRMTARTTTVRMPSGIVDDTSSLMTCRRSLFSRQ